MMYQFATLLFSVFLLSASSACIKPEEPDQGDEPQKQSEAEQKKHLEYVKKRDLWADSVLKTMTEAEKIGQLFMIAGYSNKGEAHAKATEYLIKQHHIGGMIMMQGAPIRQAMLTNRYQKLSRIPLLIASDAEWGLAMRLDSVVRYPRAMVLGAIDDESTIYDFGKEIARQSKRLGMHINFAPVVDVNSNPKNPVIGTRSFGESKENVAEKASAYARGMQDNGLIANAKHFPGHGDTDKDSHYTLPFLGHGTQRLDEIELYPFKKLIKDGVMSMMIAHLNVPSLDNSGTPTSLSPKVVKELLIDSLKYKGLIFTDGLGMKGVANSNNPGEAEIKAILAGNDMLLIPMSVSKGKMAIQKALKNGKLTWNDINQRVLKILRAKYFAGLYDYKPIKLNNLYEDLNNHEAKLMKERIFREAVTVVKNKNKVLPFRKLDSLKFGSVAIGIQQKNGFQEILSKYAKFDHHVIQNKNAYEYSYTKILNEVADNDVVVVSLHNIHTNKRGKSFGISATSRNFIKKLQQKTKVVVVVFGNPYSLKYFDNSDWLVCAYDDDKMMRKIVPQVLFGAVGTKAKLPITASEKLPVGTGFEIPELGRLKYSNISEGVGLNHQILKQIDVIADYAMTVGAMPGCQVLVAKNGTVVLDEDYGYHTYQKKQFVRPNSVYDLASVTKVVSTTQAVMKLYDQGIIKDLNDKVSKYLPDLKGTNKQNITIRDLMLHQAGVVQSMPFWYYSLSKGQFRPDFYASECSENFGIKVMDNLYVRSDIEEHTWERILDHKLRRNKNRDGSYGYLYSDLGFHILQKLVEYQTGMSLNTFVEQTFYQSLGMAWTGYLPLNKIAKDQIVPTEKDTYYRKTELQGVVHDPDAALRGGVAGHAGVFGTANDLAILMQMLLQKGNYGGLQYFQHKTTVPDFTRQQVTSNRRGLGWDKPSKSSGRPASYYASKSSFGHRGFTGTCVWADPENDIVYIFLSNRTYPEGRTNRKLQQYKVRERMQDMIYLAMDKYAKKAKNYGFEFVNKK